MSLTLEPGTLAAMAIDTTSAGPSAVLPDSSKLHQSTVYSNTVHNVSTMCKASTCKPSAYFVNNII